MQLTRIVFAPLGCEIVEVARDLRSPLLVERVHPSDDARYRSAPLPQASRPHDHSHQDADEQQFVEVDTEHLSPSALRDGWRERRGVSGTHGAS